MGRKRKYFTEEEKRMANNKKAMKYYLLNREHIKKKNLKRYHEKIDN